MYFTTALLLAGLPSALAVTYNVTVGANGRNAFDPEYVAAEAGDVVNFIFNPKNHTVTQSAFDPPCVRLDGGLASGFQPVTPETNPLPTFQVNVTGKTPLWFYCGQTGHCGQGMVFSINPPEDPSPNSFKAHKDLAIARNGTGPASVSPSSVGVYTTPPAPHWVTATATVTGASSTWTTTYTSYDGTPPPTPAAQPQDHKIIVGPDGQFVFSPARVEAAIGDTVTFEFRQKNHTVTQSSFMQPCRPLRDTSLTGEVGFTSGFQPVAADATTFPTFQIKVNDTAPIWGYCEQVNHCGAGMVFAINSVESGSNSLAAFQGLAQRINGTGATGPGSGSGSGSGSNNGAIKGGFSARVGAGAGMALALALALGTWFALL
ncbi:hypothetical protein HGRIS_013473 [Hohenbuehelia grisea]|uniref:Cupredoxin n=1 Tax=Hohenbuehelia grisea TaxID=104357 RepID=A0ABR3IVK6_9AGAR